MQSWSVSPFLVRSRGPPFAVACWCQPRSRWPNPFGDGVAISGPAEVAGVLCGTKALLWTCCTLGVQDRTVSKRRRWSPDGMVTAGRTPSPARDGEGPSTVGLVGGLRTPLWTGHRFGLLRLGEIPRCGVGKQTP